MVTVHLAVLATQFYFLGTFWESRMTVNLLIDYWSLLYAPLVNQVPMVDIFF